MRGREGEGREDIWGGRGRRGRGFGGFDGVLVSLISFDSSGMVLGNQILAVEPAVMHRVPPPFFSRFFLVARCPFEVLESRIFLVLRESCCPTTNRYRFLLVVFPRVTLQREMLKDWSTVAGPAINGTTAPCLCLLSQL